VIGKEKALLKDSLLVALYAPFLSSPLDLIPELDFAPEEIAAQAYAMEIEGKRA